MKIKSKLLLALLLVSLVPIFFGAIFSYYNSRNALTRSMVNHLKSVSSTQHARVNEIIARNLERLSLVASRTQLRITLAASLDNGTRKDLDRLGHILSDALTSIDDFICISVYSPAGVVVVSTDPALVGDKHFDQEFFDRCRTQNTADYFFRDRDGKLRLYLSGPLYLEKRFIGVIVVTSRVDNLLSLVRDYSGLGNTGETLLVKRNGSADSVFLLPTRFGKEEAVGQVLSSEKNYAATHAYAEEKFITDSIDYREQPVLAVARQVEATGWGMVVKIDKDEAYASVDYLRRMLLMMVILAVVVILGVALYIANGFSGPIDHLATVAEKIAGGDLSLKAEVTSVDEVGVLARSFNKMVDSLLQTSSDLEVKVDQLQAEVVAREQSESEKERLIGELQDALTEIKTLKGIMPICASCKKIRDDKGFWSQIEAYVSAHSDVEFSHGLCPDCAKTLYPEIDLTENK
ncbi:MAG: HAMP domain-containing protein [Desulfobulbaceae bacterium]|nr:HAMP domain-containing protein [Desulfobulbaceae bacterium]